MFTNDRTDKKIKSPLLKRTFKGEKNALLQRININISKKEGIRQMIYIKDGNKLKTLKEISLEYKIPLKLIQGRHSKGITTLEELIKPKHYNIAK